MSWIRVIDTVSVRSIPVTRYEMQPGQWRRLEWRMEISSQRKHITLLCFTQPSLGYKRKINSLALTGSIIG